MLTSLGIVLGGVGAALIWSGFTDRSLSSLARQVVGAPEPENQTGYGTGQVFGTLGDAISKYGPGSGGGGASTRQK